jgi:hypothetical protein
LRWWRAVAARVSGGRRKARQIPVAEAGILDEIHGNPGQAVVAQTAARKLHNLSPELPPAMPSPSRCLPLILAALCVVASAATAADSIGYFDAIASDPAPIVGQQYYTRHCFMYEKGAAETTNYWRGSLVPINTQVTLVALDGKKLVVRLPSGEAVSIDNVEKFSRRSTSTIAHNLLATQPVPISSFNDATGSAIKSGILKMGMTKEQVIMARGYPPGHKTPTLDFDTWTYWSSRFVTQSLVFSNGVLVRGRDVLP